MVMSGKMLCGIAIANFYLRGARFKIRCIPGQKDNLPEVDNVNGKQVIAWFHDEVIFYAHDRCKKAWYHKDAAPKPYVKGEGALAYGRGFRFSGFWMATVHLMEKKNAQRIMKPGKNRDGYFQAKILRNRQTQLWTFSWNIILSMNINLSMTMHLAISSVPRVLSQHEICQRIFQTRHNTGALKCRNAMWMVTWSTTPMDQSKA